MKKYVFLALIVLAEVIPFSSRAVFMDEHIFLKIANNVRDNWRFPQDLPSVFFGIPLANFAAHTHPPVGEYCLALLYRLLGPFSEVPFRLAFSVFSIAAVLAFYSIATRFTRQPFLVSVLFALSPAFCVMAPTLMMDIPMLAFLLCGIAFYFLHLEGKKRALSAAGFCFVLAAGTGYTALVPLACVFVSMLLGRRPWKELLAVAAAPMALTVWQVLVTIHFGSFPLANTVAYYSGQSRISRNLAALCSFVGGVALFPWSGLFLSRRPRTSHIITALGLAAVPAVTVSVNSPATRAWYFLLAGSGILIIVLFFQASRQIMASAPNAGESFLILWVPATFIFFIVVADMMNARYILLALPALYLVLFRETSARDLKWILVPTGMLSLCLAYADFTFVNSYRDWARQTVGPLQQDGFRVWSAAESGLRFYLEQRGISTLTAKDERPRGTDLIVSHDLFRYGLSEDVTTMLVVLKRFPLQASFPLQTFNPRSGAGFHDSGIGITPFAISRATLDYVEVDEVSPFVEQFPQHGIPAEEVPAWSPNGVILKQDVDVREFKLRIPDNSKLEYEIVGKGTAEKTGNGIVLKRSAPGTIVWQRFRIVPVQFIREGS